MRRPSVGQIVYNATFPRPRTNEPGSFGAHITRNLVPEVRVETSLFYGSLDCIEAQYPGLDYSYGPHRMRLSRFPWHRKLFQTFDELRLTEEEISNLCRWEGTKSARQRYEAEEGITVRDTTAHSVRPASPQPAPSIEIHFNDCDFCGTEEEEDQSIETQSNDTVRAIDSRASSYQSAEEEHEIEEELSDEEMESCGVALNNRILAAMAARDQGTDVPLDEDWEQWLKEAGERGGFEMVQAIRANQPLTLVADNVRIPRGRGAARVVTRAALFTVPDSIIATNTALPSTSNHTSGTAQ
ncbi:uncharacterized protein N7479_004064 [Penicillium vulpinum]|uniref:Uncharacterized protein n=1 Tax=Penicillium vulpinum TaxID=29845 RepID=A0A1V6SBY4_9EURO|nr:uncharacterized protein N7479_004064 [Penicillium vulpinum]KAJ5964188.1 hypothetical protein N7479_004064 [Penicillium vulpinum]OQE11507.1 hypothetical protein PENVUL_c002G05477 [Penicillium vulpinum]